MSGARKRLSGDGVGDRTRMNGFMGVMGSRRSGHAAHRVEVGLLMVGWIGIALSAMGCSEVPIEPVRVTNDHLGRLAIAVAPAMNFSGSADFDPNRPNSLASDLAQLATAARIVFETPRPGIGCFTEVEMMLMMRP